MKKLNKNKAKPDNQTHQKVPKCSQLGHLIHLITFKSALQAHLNKGVVSVVNK